MELDSYPDVIGDIDICRDNWLETILISLYIHNAVIRIRGNPGEVTFHLISDIVYIWDCLNIAPIELTKISWRYF